MSVKSTVARTRSRSSSRCTPARNSVMAWMTACWSPAHARWSEPPARGASPRGCGRPGLGRCGCPPRGRPPCEASVGVGWGEVPMSSGESDSRCWRRRRASRAHHSPSTTEHGAHVSPATLPVQPRAAGLRSQVDETRRATARSRVRLARTATRWKPRSPGRRYGAREPPASRTASRYPRGLRSEGVGCVNRSRTSAGSGQSTAQPANSRRKGKCRGLRGGRRWTLPEGRRGRSAPAQHR